MPAADWTTNLGLFLATIAVWFVLGVLSHEATHWFVAWVLGADDIDVDVNVLGGGSVTYAFETGVGDWRPFLINASPQLVGLFVGVPSLVWLWMNGANGLLLFIATVFVASYSVLGSPSDLLPFLRSRDGHLWHPSKLEQGLTLALGMILIGFVAMFVPSGEQTVWVVQLGRMLVIGGIVTAFALIVLDAKRGTDGHVRDR